MMEIFSAVERHQSMYACFHLSLPFFSSSLCLCCIILHSVVNFAFRSISAEAVFTLFIGQNIEPCWNSDSVCLHNMTK